MRITLPIALVLLLTLGFSPALAQDTTPIPPLATPTATLAPVLAPSNTPTPTLPPPTATPLPDISTLLTDANATQDILLAARNDLEILANATVGSTNRPDGWSGSYAINDPDMALKARLDLETLANQILPQRPPNWFGARATSGYSIARDIRHDLELLADQAVAPSIRPPNWIGDDPIMRCSRSTQALALLLISRSLYTPTASPASPTYCFDLESEISVYTEVNLLDIIPTPTPLPGEGESGDDPDTPAAVSIVGENAQTYLDRGATTRAGVVPAGTPIEPIARSYAQFSRMTLVRGDDFLLFVDYQDTTLALEEFEALNNVNTLDATPFCNADWCE